MDKRLTDRILAGFCTLLLWSGEWSRLISLISVLIHFALSVVESVALKGIASVNTECSELQSDHLVYKRWHVKLVLVPANISETWQNG